MDARSALLTGLRKTMRNAASTAAVAALPAASPTADSTDCASLESWRGGASAPRAAKVSLKGSTTATLTSAVYVGWNANTALWEELGRVNEGRAVTLSTTRGFGQVLYDVAACYSHVSIVGTLSAGTLTATIEPIEADE
jgi:hypothetical protein